MHDHGEFAERYAVSGAEALVDAEREVLGSDDRANGYTTMTQADALGRLVAVGPGDRLIDLGSGCGWPGLHLAARHGCSVVTVDPAHDGNLAGRARAIADGLSDRHLAVTADGWSLPFRSGSFDAIVHGDVLCRIGPKLSVPRACRRVLRPGGRMALTTIEPTAELDEAGRRRPTAPGRSGSPRGPATRACSGRRAWSRSRTTT